MRSRSAAGRPCQRVLPAGQARAGLPARQVPAGGLAAAVAALAGQGFDLEAEVPLRAVLLVAGPGEHVLVVVIHHIAGDGWSEGVLARDISVVRGAAGGPGAGVGAAAGAVRRLRDLAAGAAR